MGAKSSKKEVAANESADAAEAPASPSPLPPVRRARRTSVSAEVDKTTGPVVKKVIPKTKEQCDAILMAVSGNFLFSSLPQEQLDDVVAAMEVKQVSAGENVITVGEEGNHLYVISTGELDVYLANSGDKPVRRMTAGMAFGELALMYNAPRSATIKAVSACTLFALDRATFRSTIMEAGKERRKKYEDFLKNVEILKAASLSQGEVSQLADAVEPVTFADEEVIIKQGDDDRAQFKFYIIEEGEAKAFVNKDGEEIFMSLMGPGEYFGEKALVEKTPRTATVKAAGKLKLASLGIAAFERLMGNCEDILKERARAEYLNPDDVRTGRVSPKGTTPNASPKHAEEKREGARTTTTQ